MRLSLRAMTPLLLGIAGLSVLFAGLEVRADRKVRRQDSEKRAAAAAQGLQNTVETMLETSSRADLERVLEEFSSREHLTGAAVYDEHGGVLAATPLPPALLGERGSWAAQALAQSPSAQNPGAHSPGLQGPSAENSSENIQLHQRGNEHIHVYQVPIYQDSRQDSQQDRGPGSRAGSLAIFYDTSSIDGVGASLWGEKLGPALIEAVLVALITLLVFRWSIAGPIARTAQWLRDARFGKESAPPEFPEEGLFKPLSNEVTSIARSLSEARATAEEEARLREARESVWTAQRLRFHVRGKLKDSALFVVSNREPFIHVRRDKSLEVMVPASGLVTAMEPILLACDGTWIAHGSGDADAEVVDEHDRLRVPPDHPQYTLRRVWLSTEEELGYYYGFANEGLWPLCHIAHTRPTFREADWAQYQAVNRKFAEVALEEMEGMEQPFLLVQDYHFALLPRLVKQKRPDARVAIFWHIPWPNPQAFSICPWQRDLLDGLLGADLVGFHIQSHCNYFLETVNDSLESRVDWGNFAANRAGHRTVVRPFPISVAFPEPPDPPSEDSTYALRSQLLERLGVEAAFMGIGVDRVDYTKGILERFHAIERFLEKRPAYHEKFTFVQIGAPSRTNIRRYVDLLAELEAEAGRINGRFQSGRWKPLVFAKRHHSHEEIEQYYKAADLCMVTSLHDGMNLVAKEFITSRTDGEGALILSRFAGAASELRDALLVNPYDTEQVADALALALEMDPEERRLRMRQMRRTVREHNVYRWAADLIGELAEIRVEAPRVAVMGHPSRAVRELQVHEPA